jgi:hypothetical protein
MADNFLERQRQDYERRKAAWLNQKKRVPKRLSSIEKPEDESL